MALFGKHTWFGKAGTWLKNEGGKVLNTVAKTVGDLGIPMVSSVAKGLDLLIPDKKVEAISKAVDKAGFVDQFKIEESVKELVPASDVKETAELLTTAMSASQNVPVLFEGGMRPAATQKRLLDVSIKTGTANSGDDLDFNALLKKPFFYIPVIGILVYFLFFRNQRGGRRYGR